MEITAEEILMYKVMSAIYSSGIPISFKGSMVMKLWNHSTPFYTVLTS